MQYHVHVLQYHVHLLQYHIKCICIAIPCMVHVLQYHAWYMLTSLLTQQNRYFLCSMLPHWLMSTLAAWYCNWQFEQGPSRGQRHHKYLVPVPLNPDSKDLWRHVRKVGLCYLTSLSWAALVAVIIVTIVKKTNGLVMAHGSMKRWIERW